ncbi:tripartite tricarboxylate transporter TctB family protein [Sinorhizobium meliloti]|uniref:tripartite tricarboxylate transporter TctB family protein n=1 Tax=Rhizobium meliloti TaxID=382 RepID=UPI000426DEC7|nr:tripartite tricarboxylate transporter TctB family protein [Sinorhizobium meliloti]
MDIKNLAASLVLLATGLSFGLTSLFGMDVGSALRMGPGYFPLVLSILITGIGLAVGLRALTVSQPFHPQHAPVRSIVAIIVAPILFGLTIRGLGFIPAVLLTAVSAAMAAKGQRPQIAVVIALAITVFCLAVFYYGLGLPVRLFGPWIGV